MSKIQSVLSDESRRKTAEQAQAAAVDLINLALQGKQLHWNLVGPRFLMVHEHLDTLVDYYREKSDDFAERAVALGVPADGRVGTIAKTTSLPELPEGWVQDNQAIAYMVERLQDVIRDFRKRMLLLDDHDMVTQDMFVETIAELEKQSWMLQAQAS